MLTVFTRVFWVRLRRFGRIGACCKSMGFLRRFLVKKAEKLNAKF